MLGIFNPMAIFVASTDSEAAGVEQSNHDPSRRQYTLPSQLTETTIVCEAKEKPLTLLALLDEAFTTTSSSPDRHRHASSCAAQGSLCLVFVSSVGY
jgi:hypothetical protein